VPAFQNAAAAALAAVRRLAGVSATLKRGASAQAITATVGKTVFKAEAAAQGPASIRDTQARDYLLPAAEYLVDGVAVLPQLGDQIVEGAATFEVVSLDSEPPYRFADPGRTWLRVHTTLVDS